jgi:hypothetical protein
VGSTTDNTWNIAGSNAGTLASASIAGLVNFTSVQNLTGGAANNTFVFMDGAGIAGNIQGGGSGALDYSAYTTGVSVNLQTDTATGVGGTISGIQSLTGGGGNNTLVGADVPNVWNLTGTNAGSVTGTGTVAFTAFENLIGGAAPNTFVFSDGAGLSGNLDGGSGGGSLDYSAYTSNVVVDLPLGSATGVGGSIANIHNLTGGAGSNILVGNGGNVLTGGTGRNLLIAGASASMLVGGGADNILIGGTTAYDMDLASLQAIMDYWAGPDDYNTRVANLTSGNGVPLLDATMVTGNGAGNTLQGGPGLDLFYGNLALDTIMNWDPATETFVSV